MLSCWYVCVCVCVCTRACRLADCLRVFGPVDWQLGALVCQTLWNLLEVGGSERESLQTLDDQERGALLDILSLYLGRTALVTHIHTHMLYNTKCSIIHM